MAPAPACDSAVSPCLRDYLVFLQRHFPPGSPPSCPLWPSPHSQQQTLPWDCSSIPILQLLAGMHSRRLASLPRTCRAVARIVSVFCIPFNPSQINCCTLQQSQMLLLCPNQLCQCRDLTSRLPSP